MLWNLIYDFFVNYIFGGYLSNGTAVYSRIFGYGISSGYQGLINTDEVPINLFGFNIPISNYLSLIATIITMIIILLVIGHFIKKTFNLFGRII